MTKLLVVLTTFLTCFALFANASVTINLENSVEYFILEKLNGDKETVYEKPERVNNATSVSQEITVVNNGDSYVNIQYSVTNNYYGFTGLGSNTTVEVDIITRVNYSSNPYYEVITRSFSVTGDFKLIHTVEGDIPVVTIPDALPDLQIQSNASTAKIGEALTFAVNPISPESNPLVKNTFYLNNTPVATGISATIVFGMEGSNWIKAETLLEDGTILTDQMEITVTPVLTGCAEKGIRVETINYLSFHANNFQGVYVRFALYNRSQCDVEYLVYKNGVEEDVSDNIITYYNFGTYTIDIVANFSDGTTWTGQEIMVIEPIGCTEKDITLQMPAMDTEIFTGEPVTFVADVEDECDLLESVTIAIDDNLVGTSKIVSTTFQTAGTHLVTATATFSDGTILETSEEIYISEEDTDDIMGVQCADPNATEVFTLKDEFTVNATSFQWWVVGATASIQGNGSSVTTVFSPYFIGDEICVGVHYNGAPYHQTYCKLVDGCDNSGTSPSEALTIAPNPSTTNFTISVVGAVNSYTITNQNTGVTSYYGYIAPGQSITVGDSFAPGSYTLTAYTASGETIVRTLVKQ